MFLSKKVTKKRVVEEGQTFSDYLMSQQNKIDDALRAWFQSKPQEKILEAACYSLFLPSKRLRSLLCLETCYALCGQEDRAMSAAMALEILHTYSLIHDDLPVMDNGELRRGKLTNHRVYGEGLALLAGDGLLTAAFEVLAKSSASAQTCIKWMVELAEAAGMEGMVLGQQIDIENNPFQTEEQLEFLHRKKTGALLAASFVMGAEAAGAEEFVQKSLAAFGQDLGLAFQIRDDILDLEGNATLGKSRQKDTKNHKSTYVSVLGLEKAKQRSQYWHDQALKKLSRIHFSYENRLEELARFIIKRLI